MARHRCDPIGGNPWGVAPPPRDIILNPRPISEVMDPHALPPAKELLQCRWCDHRSDATSLMEHARDKHPQELRVATTRPVPR